MKQQKDIDYLTYLNSIKNNLSPFETLLKRDLNKWNVISGVPKPGRFIVPIAGTAGPALRGTAGLFPLTGGLPGWSLKLSHVIHFLGRDGIDLAASSCVHFGRRLSQASPPSCREAVISISSVGRVRDVFIQGLLRGRKLRRSPPVSHRLVSPPGGSAPGNSGHTDEHLLISRGMSLAAEIAVLVYYLTS